MINTNELRLNNIVTYKQIFYKIVEIRKDELIIRDCVGRFTQIVNSIHVEPILMSDDVLRKFGFFKASIEDKFGGWIKSNIQGDFHIRIMDDYTFQLNIARSVTIDSAHHLQNLYLDIVREGLLLVDL